MGFKLKRTYTDVNGIQRTLIWKEDVDGLVGYRKGEGGVVYSGASRWHTEDGSVIQIPEDIYNFTGIEYKDEYVYHDDPHPKDIASMELKKKVIANGGSNE